MTRSHLGIRGTRPTNNDERHHISLSGIVQLPLGFQVAPIVSYGSARPYDLRSGFDVLARGVANSGR